MHPIATCHTPDCVGEGEPIVCDFLTEHEQLRAADPDIPPVTNIVCGGCGEPITDVVPPLGG